MSTNKVSDQLLRIENATVRYRQEVIFENLDFDLRKGQHWAIVGESGSGKSALLKTLAGKFYLSKGKIDHCFYRDYIRSSEVKDPYFTYHDLISYVDIRHDFRNLSNMKSFYYQQRYNSWDSEDALTVDAYLRANESKYSHGEWTIDKVLQELHLMPLHDKQLIKLSNGESKRLRLGVALLKNPVLLLVDNPFAGLDVSTRTYFNQLFENIARSGVTIVMVTSPKEIPDLITHVACIDRYHQMKTYKKGDFSADWLEKKEKHSLNKHLLERLALYFKKITYLTKNLNPGYYSEEKQ